MTQLGIGMTLFVGAILNYVAGELVGFETYIVMQQSAGAVGLVLIGYSYGMVRK